MSAHELSGPFACVCDHAPDRPHYHFPEGKAPRGFKTGSLILPLRPGKTRRDYP